jgi:hypothetical protein
MYGPVFKLQYYQNKQTDKQTKLEDAHELRERREVVSEHRMKITGDGLELENFLLLISWK